MKCILIRTEEFYDHNRVAGAILDGDYNKIYDIAEVRNNINQEYTAYYLYGFKYWCFFEREVLILDTLEL